MGISGNLVYQKLEQGPPDIGPTTGHKMIATHVHTKSQSENKMFQRMNILSSFIFVFLIWYQV